MRVRIEYTVPVVAIVDTDEGTVEEVAVIDEEITLDLSSDAYNDDTNDILGAQARSEGHTVPSIVQKAIDIAEGEVWPGWGFGR